MKHFPRPESFLCAVPSVRDAFLTQRSTLAYQSRVTLAIACYRGSRGGRSAFPSNLAQAAFYAASAYVGAVWE